MNSVKIGIIACALATGALVEGAFAVAPASAACPRGEELAVRPIEGTVDVRPLPELRGRFRVEPGERRTRVITWWPDLTPEVGAVQNRIAAELKRVTGAEVEICHYANTPVAGDILVSTQPWAAPGAWKVTLAHGILEIHGADNAATVAAATAFIDEFLAREPTGRGSWEIADFTRTHGPQYDDVKAATVERVRAARAAEGAPDWENEFVTQSNRAPARAWSFPLASAESALGPDLPKTPFAKSLNGTWRLRWVGRPADRPADFFRSDFDDSDWNDVRVPGCVETQGFGLPIYTNKRFPHPATPPKLDSDYNPVSCYRTTFTVPGEWRGRTVYLRFDGVLSGFCLWVNGTRVGYSEDSFLPAEFDVTPYLWNGENTLAVEVYRWTDGSYLEDQDFFRFSGIFRDVTLWSMPKDGVWDFHVKTDVSADFTTGTLSVDGVDGDWEATLHDAARRPVAKLTSAANSATVRDVALWTAETPNLYTLVLRKGTDIRAAKVGFRKVALREDGAVLYNGRAIKFRGVNRHEASPDGGRTVSRAEMERDVMLMKRYNIDTVRTAHYPCDPYFYHLCERHGLYVMAEANVESHGLGYGTNSLAQHPSWELAHVERNARHVVNYRNSPSVFMWSLGNEAGPGPCFDAATEAVRRLDPSIPVIYRNDCGKLPIDADTYFSIARTHERGLYPKCFFHIEYAHAMGNALGHLSEYWDEYWKSPSLVGGCIWDWVDQGVWKQTDRIGPDGRRLRYLAYGGDFDEEPNDGNFCANGIIDAERHVTPKLEEVGHVQRSLIVRAADGGFELENRYGFTNASAFEGRWEIVSDGEPVDRGTFEVPDVPPLTTARLSPSVFGVALCPAGGETFLNVSFALKQSTGWAPKGWVVSRNQLALGGTPNAPSTPPSTGVAVSVSEDADGVTVRAGKTVATFSRASGTLSRLEMNGKPVLADAAGIVRGPRLTCARAFTDNDGWLRTRTSRSPEDLPTFYESGLTQLRYHPTRLTVTNGADGAAVVTARVRVDGAKSAGWEHTAEWTFRGDGSATVRNTVAPHGRMPILPRLGTTWILDPRLEQTSWYGRGPHENYFGRNSSAFVGRHDGTVTDSYVGYIRPQTCGGRSDVRWFALTDAEGDGVRFAFDVPGYAQALHFSWEDLEFARHRAGQQRIWHPLEPRAEVFLDLDAAQTGIGEGSCGEIPLEKYRLTARPMTWTMTMSPCRNTQAWRNGEREPLWPEGKIPDFRPQQIGGMTDEESTNAAWRAAHRMPYLEWFERPAKPNGACMILVSGGGYFCCCDVGLVGNWREKLTEAGYQCVNLVYRTPRPKGIACHQTAWEDGQRAVRLVRAAAAARGFDPEKIGAIGMSAGGHLVCLLAANALTPAYAKVDATDDVPCHLNWAIANAPAYNTANGAAGGQTKEDGVSVVPKISPVFSFDAKTCPVCFHHGGKDPWTPNGSTLMYRELRKRKIPGELHLYADKVHGAHGFDRALEFMHQMNFDGRLGKEVDLVKRYASDDARASCVREPVWPKGMTPDAHPGQCEPYLEWHLPKELKTKAIQIVFSGGSYRHNDPDSFEVAPIRRYLNRLGMTVVTLKYRTPRPSGESDKHLSAWQDLQRTIRLVRGEAEGRGLDPNRIGVMGSSAGGHLALLGAMSSRTPAYAPVDGLDSTPCNVQWAIAVYPAYVFVPDSFTGAEPCGEADEITFAPEFAFDEDTCPVCFLHGDADVCQTMNSVRLWEKLRTMGIQCDLHTLATRNHCFQAHAAEGTGSYTWMERVWGFLSRKGFNR